MRYKLPEDTSFRLRMNAALLAAAQDRAAREGRSMSALVRDALRRELELAA